MKILKLYLKNLNSFQKEVVLDFTEPPLSDSNLTVVTGPTGAGKTTLLDAICVALYAKTPRLDGNGDQHPNNMLSQGKNEGIAEVTFSANGRRYLAEWRTKRSSSGNFTPSGKLIDLDSSKTITERLQAKRHSNEASNPSVADVVTEILGLDFSAFRRSVMLAQGDFSAFLKSKMEQRRAILEATTGMTIYDQLKQELNEAVSESNKEFDKIAAKLDATPEVAEEQIQHIEHRLQNKEEERNQLQSKRHKIDSEKKEVNRRQKIYQRFIQNSEELEILDQQQDEMEKLKKELKRANQAVQLQSEMSNFQLAEKELQQVKAKETEANQKQKSVLPAWKLANCQFSQADQSYRQAFSDSQEKRKQFQLAREEENLAKSAFSLANEYAERAKEIRGKILQQKTETQQKQEQVNQLREQIEMVKSKTANLNLPTDLDPFEKNLQIVKTLLIEGKEKTDHLADIEQESQKQLAQIEQWRTDQQQAEKQLTTHQKNESQLQQSLQQAEQKLRDLETQESDWKKEKKLIQSAQTIGNQLLVLGPQIDQQINQNQLLIYELNNHQSELESICEQQQVIEKEREQFVQQVCELEAEFTDQYQAIQLNKLRHQLEPNQPCPVCGSLEHFELVKTDQTTTKPIEIEEITNQLEKAKKHLAHGQSNSDQIHQKRIKVDIHCQSLKRQMEQGEIVLKQLKNDHSELAENWSDLYPKETMPAANDILNWVDIRRALADQNLDLLNQAKLNRQKASSHVEQWLLKQDQLMDQSQSKKQQLQKSEQDFQQTKAKTERLESEIQLIKNQIIDLMRLTTDDMYSIDDLVSRHLKQVELLVSARLQKKDLQQLSHQMEQLEFQISKIQVDDLEAECKLIEDNFHQKTATGHSLISAARSKTHGLSANEAEEIMNQKLDDWRLQREQAESELQQAEQRRQIAEEHVSFYEQKTMEINERYKQAKLAYQVILKKYGFSDIDAHQRSLREVKWISKQTTRWQSYDTHRASCQQQRVIDQQALIDSPFDPDQSADLSDQENQVTEELSQIQQQIGAEKQTLAQLRLDFNRRTQQVEQSKSIREEKMRWERLQSVIPDNTLRDFALEQMFDMLTQLANQQLLNLTNRYELHVHSMKEMKVVDRWNANQERPVETLSGGESFLTSLSLALALSEMSRGRSQLQSLFLDEGFGTLDAETLDVAISALENLRFSGKHVVVISHVKELTRRIPQQIRVDKMNNGSSRVRVTG